MDELVTIIAFLERPEVWDPKRGSLRNFLFSCIKYRSLDALRAYHRQGRRRLRRYLSHGAPLYLTDKADLEEKEAEEWLLDRVALLPNRLLEPFRLFAFEGKSHREIAEALGMTENYAKCLLFRARRFLQNRVERFSA